MKKRTKRKIYKLVNPIAHAIEGASLMSRDKIDRLKMLELSAIESFAKGRATLDNWQQLCGMMNICETMAQQGIGIEALEACKSLEAALIDCQQRYERTKRMGTTGEGLKAMRDVHEYADLQRQSIDLSTFERMIDLTTARIKSKAPGVTEL